ncbi:MAG: class I SAM-dependent methyltransferase [Acidobacteriota bacterium]
MKFNDQFSKLAASYLRYRPRYPKELFSYLASLAPSLARAWDAATGNGQSALALVEHFNEVIATDASAEQIAQASRHERIDYRVAPSEKTDIESGSVDLVTVSQALHWFRLDEFYREARRVLKPQGVIAVWVYRFIHVADEIDRVLEEFHEVTVKPFWLPENDKADNRFLSLPFPFKEISAPPFEMEARWTLEHLKGFLGTWSAVERYKQARRSDPVESITEELKRVWGDPDRERTIRWPLLLRVGRAG